MSLSLIKLSGGMINESIGLFHKKSAAKASKPFGIDAFIKWTKNINNGKDLLVINY
jgi:hypothetical protein